MKDMLKEVSYSVLAVVAAFMFGGLIVLVVGDDPLLVYELFLSSAFGSIDGVAYTLFYATPLIFTGLAVAVAFKCGLLNIGAEGQLVAAAFTAAWVGLVLPGWPPLVAIVAIAASLIVGGVWAGVPGILKAKFGAHEVITTIMMNFIAFGIVSYLTQYHYRKPGDPILETLPIAEISETGDVIGPHVPRMHSLLSVIGIDFPDRLPLNLAFLIALIACAAVYVFLWRTRWGYELLAVGTNPAAAEYGGISTRRNITIAMGISGMLAGMVAINEVLGFRYRYYDGFSANYGFTGIAVALLGRSHPAGVLASAILFGALTRSGLFIDIFTDKVSKDWVLVLQGIIILFVACESVVRRKKA
jgi:simple sugar transport system permease protein